MDACNACMRACMHAFQYVCNVNGAMHAPFDVCKGCMHVSVHVMCIPMFACVCA